MSLSRLVRLSPSSNTWAPTHKVFVRRDEQVRAGCCHQEQKQMVGLEAATVARVYKIRGGYKTGKLMTERGREKEGRKGGREAWPDLRDPIGSILRGQGRIKCIAGSPSGPDMQKHQHHDRARAHAPLLELLAQLCVSARGSECVRRRAMCICARGCLEVG